MTGDLLPLLMPLREALERVERKAQPLLRNPDLLNTEQGQDRLDVIAHQVFDLDADQVLLKGRWTWEAAVEATQSCCGG